MNKILNNIKGLTLIELMATIVVGSVVTMILMQILTMTVTYKTRLDIENKTKNNSYIITETLKRNITLLEPQQLELIDDGVGSSEIRIRISHLIDYEANGNNEIVELPNLIEQDLVIVKTIDGSTYELWYNDVQLNSGIFLGPSSSIELIPVDACDFNATPCSQGILKITLEISVITDAGTVLDTQIFETTILI